MATYRKLKTGKRRWYAEVWLGRDPRNPRKKLTQSRTFTTEKDARAWATALEVSRNKGEVRTTMSKATLAEYITDTWLPACRIKDKSTYNTEQTLGKWILFTSKKGQPHDVPFLGSVKLRDLTVDHFDTLYRAMAKHHGIRKRGIEHLHGLLRRVFMYAVKKGHLAHNPAKGVDIPDIAVHDEVTQDAMRHKGKGKGKVRYLDREQLIRVLQVAKTHRWSALWHLLADAGLRPGEAFALNWAQVDLDAKLVTVAANLTRTQRDDRTKGWQVMDPKTGKSERDVPISDATVKELKAWKAKQAAQRLRMGPEWQDHGFVFTTDTGSPLGNTVNDEWAKLLRAADGGRGDLVTWAPEVEERERKGGRPPQRKCKPKFVLYVLRHTSATLALLDGVDLLQVSRRLGHTDLAFTADRYGHVKAEHTTQAAESFNRLAASIR